MSAKTLAEPRSAARALPTAWRPIMPKPSAVCATISTNSSAAGATNPWPSANRANYGRLIPVPIPGQFMDILRIAEQTAGEALSKKGRPLWGRDALDPPVREAEPLTSPASQNAAVASGHVPPEPAPPMAVRCTATRIRRKLSI